MIVWKTVECNLLYCIKTWPLLTTVDGGHFSLFMLSGGGVESAKHSKSDLHVVWLDLSCFSFRTYSLALLWTSSTYHHASITMYQISYFLQHQRNQQFAVSRVSNGSFHFPHPVLNSIWGLRIQISVKWLPALGGWWCMVSPICIQTAACSTRLGEKIWTAACVDRENLKRYKYSILLVKSQEASSHFQLKFSLLWTNCFKTPLEGDLK